MQLTIIRLLRTQSSEQILLRRDKGDIGALDIHYSLNGHIRATLILFDESGIKEPEVPALLTEIDEFLFPEASIQDHNLSFTVVFGRVLGAFAPEQTTKKGN